MKKSKIIAIIICVILFIINTLFVMMGKTTNIDTAVHNFFMLFNSEITTKIMNIITFLGSTIGIIGICFCFFVYFFFTKQHSKIYSVFGVLLTSTIINNVIKFIIKRPRPEYMMVSESSYSYPSGHTMATTAFYGSLIYMIIKSNMSKGLKIMYSIILSILMLLIYSSRIYLGAHYLTDVFGGFVISLSLLFIFSLIDDKYKLI